MQPVDIRRVALDFALRYENTYAGAVKAAEEYEKYLAGDEPRLTSDDALILLHQFSEWRDEKGSLPDGWTHDDLVHEFVKTRHPRAIPYLGR